MIRFKRNIIFLTRKFKITFSRILDMKLEKLIDLLIIYYLLKNSFLNNTK